MQAETAKAQTDAKIAEAKADLLFKVRDILQLTCKGPLLMAVSQGGPRRVIGEEHASKLYATSLCRALSLHVMHLPCNRTLNKGFVETIVHLASDQNLWPGLTQGSGCHKL